MSTTTAKINFSGSQLFTGITFSNSGSAHNYHLSSISGWDEGPEIERETIARFNGKGSFVSAKAKVPLRTVEVEFDAAMSITLYDQLVNDFSRMRRARDITLTVTRNGRTERLSEGFISTPATITRIGNATICRVVIDFANPYIVDTSNSIERL